MLTAHDSDLPRPPVHPTRLVYLGTPALAVGPLVALHDAGHDIALVVSRADTRRGRGGTHQPSPVKAAALERGLAVTDDLHAALGVGADLGVVVAYGRIIPRPVLEQLPMVNLHFSALPRWRGAAPLERAILAGDPTTAVDLMAVEEGLDTGGIYAETIVPLGADDTLDELREKLAGADHRDGAVRSGELAAQVAVLVAVQDQLAADATQHRVQGLAVAQGA